MSENRFTVWHVFGLLIIALSVSILFLGGGLFYGFQVGRSSSFATRVAEQAKGTALPTTQAVAPSVPVHLNARRPYLGVEFEMITPELVQAENLTVNNGALIRNVMPTSPADLAELKSGDIIQSVDGQRLDLTLSLRDLVHTHQPGDQLTFSIWRAGETSEHVIKLGSVPDGFDFSYPVNEVAPEIQLQCYPGPCPNVPIGPTLQPSR